MPRLFSTPLKPAGWLLIPFACVVSALASTDPSIPTGYVHAHRLLHVAYPELFARAVAVALTMDERGEITLRVEDARNPLLYPPGAPRTRLLDVRVAFDADDRLAHFAGAGPLTRENDNQSLRKAMANPAWQDQQGRLWLSAAGAEHGPDRPPDVERALDPNRWRPFLGRDLWPAGMRFQWRDEAQPRAGGPAPPKPGWVIDVTGRGPDGRAAGYRVLFEPFSGRIVEIVTR